MSSELGYTNKNNYKKIYTKLDYFGKANINGSIKNKNDSTKQKLDELANKKEQNKTNIKKNRISPYKNHFNKSLSSALLNKPFYKFQKSKKFYIKSPLSLLQNNNNNNQASIILDINKNIPILPINQNKNNQNNKINSNQGIVEYKTINCFINNFNVSCKNEDSQDGHKSNSVVKIKKHYDYDIFNKNNNRMSDQLNLRKNNSMSNYINNIRNISNISDNNISNVNNMTNLNDESKIEGIILENKEKKMKIQQRNKENTKRLLLLKELESKNQKLKQEYQEIKNKNMEYAKSLEKLFKFLKVLKNSGLDINELMDNISSGEDYDEFDEDSELEESSNSKKKKDEEKNEHQATEGSVPISNIRQLSSGLLRTNEKFTKGSKLKINYNKINIPLLNMKKIKKHK